MTPPVFTTSNPGPATRSSRRTSGARARAQDRRGAPPRRPPLRPSICSAVAACEALERGDGELGRRADARAGTRSTPTAEHSRTRAAGRRSDADVKARPPAPTRLLNVERSPARETATGPPPQGRPPEARPAAAGARPARGEALVQGPATRTRPAPASASRSLTRSCAGSWSRPAGCRRRSGSRRASSGWRRRRSAASGWRPRSGWRPSTFLEEAPTDAKDALDVAPALRRGHAADAAVGRPLNRGPVDRFFERGARFPDRCLPQPRRHQPGRARDSGGSGSHQHGPVLLTVEADRTFVAGAARLKRFTPRRRRSCTPARSSATTPAASSSATPGASGWGDAGDVRRHVGPRGGGRRPTASSSERPEHGRRPTAAPARPPARARGRAARRASRPESCAAVRERRAAPSRRTPAPRQRRGFAQVRAGLVRAPERCREVCERPRERAGRRPAVVDHGVAVGDGLQRARAAARRRSRPRAGDGLRDQRAARSPSGVAASQAKPSRSTRRSPAAPRRRDPGPRPRPRASRSRPVARGSGRRSWQRADPASSGRPRSCACTSRWTAYSWSASSPRRRARAPPPAPRAAPPRRAARRTSPRSSAAARGTTGRTGAGSPPHRASPVSSASTAASAPGLERLDEARHARPDDRVVLARARREREDLRGRRRARGRALGSPVDEHRCIERAR